MTSPRSSTSKMGRASVTHARRPPWLIVLSQWSQLAPILDVGPLLSEDA